MDLVKKGVSAAALLMCFWLVAAGCTLSGGIDDMEGLREDGGRLAFVPTAGEAAARAYAWIGTLSGSPDETGGLLLTRWATGESGEVTITVRPFDDVEGTVTEQQLAALKEQLFAQADGVFPLEIEVLACCEQAPDVRGVVTAVDAEHGVIDVVENPTEGDVAVRVVLTADALLVGGESGEELDLADVVGGQEVAAWLSGQEVARADQISVRKLVVSGL